MSSAEPDTWFRFVRAHRCLIREIERRLAAAELPPYAWYDALWGVESGPQGMRRMHELADVMAIERYNLTRLIDRLESEGLVERHRSDSDGRGAVAAITDKGRTLRKQMWQIYETAVDGLFLAQFDAPQRRVFADALERAALAARQSGSKS
ncbi:MarR family winged helix-turn-helix transcriptional regulator [Pseudomonas savastanoi]|uniref:MarR family transcriptional regulator n=2 Tax=Pseudomonas savastanoi TaxID=29438 RepID=A0A0N8RKH1_PSESG|nr:MarR family transcriptional regulator [Pseudomonas savastanoi]EFW81355.1 MarR family transcriptional regulator [Pseudomonas savastanoi pv. glycinea str. B076]KPC23271.1 MarR family transcriptional regulator [Pseudomonas savastanoi pv. glycinea]KPC26327.1 MarR family transcriptional regulator [Pseudomonas savastanoi pv. glycinea]KPC40528.1 MarR family transcriptional regulator [Pseudomonas savastanoi pv. glycinea]KPC44014.1 MarR family transcriptional regulator [Pseudomonas savastanoi pv. gl